jgi:hypothetical protein
LAERLGISLDYIFRNQTRIKVGELQSFPHDEAGGDQAEKHPSEEGPPSPPDVRGDGLRKGYAGQENEALQPGWTLIGEAESREECDGTSQGVAHQDQLPEIFSDDQPVNQSGLVHGTVPPVLGPRRPAETLQVHHVDAAVPGQLRLPETPEMSCQAESVEEKDRRAGATHGLMVERKPGGIP